MNDLAEGVLREFAERASGINALEYRRANGFRICRASPAAVTEWHRQLQADTKSWRARVAAQLMAKYGRAR